MSKILFVDHAQVKLPGRNTIITTNHSVLNGHKTWANGFSFLFFFSLSLTLFICLLLYIEIKTRDITKNQLCLIFFVGSIMLGITSLGWKTFTESNLCISLSRPSLSTFNWNSTTTQSLATNWVVYIRNSTAVSSSTDGQWGDRSSSLLSHSNITVWNSISTLIRLSTN